jgi:hypothetical protein
VALVVEFDDGLDLHRGWVAEDEIEVLGADAIENASPRAIVQPFHSREHIGNTHFAKYPIAPGSCLIQYSQEGSFGRREQAIGLREQDDSPGLLLSS